MWSMRRGRCALRASLVLPPGVPFGGAPGDARRTPVGEAQWQGGRGFRGGDCRATVLLRPLVSLRSALQLL